MNRTSLRDTIGSNNNYDNSSGFKNVNDSDTNSLMKMRIRANTRKFIVFILFF